MAQEREIEAGDIRLRIEENKTATVTGSRGQHTILKIPALAEGYPVAAIGKKAFLGNKSLTELVLPDTLTEIGDWAFAHCTGLRRLTLPAKDLRIGKGVFKDCKSLREVETGKGREPACLLAAVPVMLDAEYLFRPLEAGSGEWLEKWDTRMFTLLHKSDESGFTRLVLCGEEDLLANLPDYVAGQRRKKAAMCLLRLLNPLGLSESSKEELEAYLRTHAKGCASEAAWETVLSEHGDERPYYEQLVKAGCVTEENIADMLEDMQEGHAEMKAFLMRYKEEKLGGGDFFDSLSLD